MNLLKDFTQRLKSERERVGLTQAAFAKRCGVGKTAQYTYESGKRFPDAAYLAEAESLGVDLSYLFSGMREEEKVDYDIAREELFGGLFAALGFTREDIDRYSRSIIPLLHDLWHEDGAHDQWKTTKLLPAALEVLNTSPFVKNISDKAYIEVGRLEAVLLAINESAQAAVLPAIARAKIAALAYRLASKHGTVDRHLIEEASALVNAKK